MTTALLYGCIYVTGWETFVQDVLEGLKRLMQTKTGKALAADVTASGKTVWITSITPRHRIRGEGRWLASAWEHDLDASRSQDPTPHAADPESLQPGGEPTERSGHPATWVPKKPGQGSNTTIEIDLTRNSAVYPVELILGHELIHARRNALGYQLRGEIEGVSDLLELEEVAVAGPHHPTLPMTGNRLRKELNALPGTTHHSPKRYFLIDAYK